MSVRSVDAGKAVDFYKDGVEMVKPNWLMLAVATLVFAIIAVVVTRVLGNFGGVITPLFGVPMAAGLFRLVRDSSQRQPFDFSRLFYAFTNTPLLINLLIIAAPSVAIGLISALAAQMGSLTLIFLMLPVSLAYSFFSMFAVQRVVFAGVDGITALKQSVAGALSNIVPIILFFIITCVACLAGMLALLVGVLFVVPLVYAAMIRMHDEIFGGPEMMANPMAPPPPPPPAQGW